MKKFEERHKTYEFENGFMIQTTQCINEVSGKPFYSISIIDKESEYNKEYVQTNIMPFWEDLEWFTFNNPKEANEQFLISYEYYKNFER